MSRRSQLIAVVLLSVVILGSWRSWLSAQAVASEPIYPPITVSGDDIAFRVEARRGNTVEGRLMVRMEGKWIEADVDGGLRVRRLTK
jgi:hypothetical protein